MSVMIASISADRPSAWPIRRACSSQREKYSGASFGWAIVGAMSDSRPKDSSSRPALVPMMRSGSRAAMLS